MTETIYWVWLQQALGLGSPKVDVLIEQFESPEKIFGLSLEELQATEFFTLPELKKIKESTLETAQKQLDKAKQLGCAVFTPDHPDFPENLTHIGATPCVLYVQGNFSLKEDLAITMVGTRKATDYGLRAAFMLARDLSAAGCVVVSGLANGIDQETHWGALSQKGRTIGMMACGLDVHYPASADVLKEKILAYDGALVSEFPFGSQALPYHFAIRNRILSGISSGVVVVEAPISSGALMTARYAAEQGKDVFAVPGTIFDVQSAGCLALIEDGAKMVKNPSSILAEYNGRFPRNIRPGEIITKIHAAGSSSPRETVHILPKKKSVVTPLRTETLQVASPKLALTELPKVEVPLEAADLEALGVSENGKRIYFALGASPIGVDLLEEKTELRVTDLMAALTQLEMLGLVRSKPGRLYLRGEQGAEGGPLERNE